MRVGTRLATNTVCMNQMANGLVDLPCGMLVHGAGDVRLHDLVKTYDIIDNNSATEHACKLHHHAAYSRKRTFQRKTSTVVSTNG